MALRQLALMTIAALAAGAYANTRRKRQSANARKPVPLQRWEGEGGHTEATLEQGRDEAALARTDDLLDVGDGRQQGSTSTPISAGQNLP